MTASRSRWRVQKKRLLLLDNDWTRQVARSAEMHYQNKGTRCAYCP